MAPRKENQIAGHWQVNTGLQRRKPFLPQSPKRVPNPGDCPANPVAKGSALWLAFPLVFSAVQTVCTRMRIHHKKPVRDGWPTTGVLRVHSSTNRILLGVESSGGGGMTLAESWTVLEYVLQVVVQSSIHEMHHSSRLNLQPGYKRCTWLSNHDRNQTLSYSFSLPTRRFGDAIGRGYLMEMYLFLSRIYLFNNNNCTYPVYLFLAPSPNPFTKHT